MALCTVPRLDSYKESLPDGRVIDLGYPEERETFESHLLVNDTSFLTEIGESAATVTRNSQSWRAHMEVTVVLTSSYPWRIASASDWRVTLASWIFFIPRT